MTTSLVGRFLGLEYKKGKGSVATKMCGTEAEVSDNATHQSILT